MLSGLAECLLWHFIFSLYSAFCLVDLKLASACLTCIIWHALIPGLHAHEQGASALRVAETALQSL